MDKDTVDYFRHSYHNHRVVGNKVSDRAGYFLLGAIACEVVGVTKGKRVPLRRSVITDEDRDYFIMGSE